MDYSKASNNIFATLENQKGYDQIYNNDTVNPYFNWTSHTGEQTLSDTLVAEAILNRGVRCIYIRRTLQNVDLVFGEDPTSKFEEHFDCAIYVESFDGWEGDGDWYSKFGFQVEDEMNVTINPNLFHKQGDGKNPLSGDLIYFPMSKGLFEISWVEPEDPWYQTGVLPQRKIKLTKFDYSGEEMNLTDEEEYIDSIDGLMDMNTDSELEPINALNDRWDNGIEQGLEMEQISDEVEKYHIKDQVVPTGSPDPSSGDDVTPPIGWGINNNNNA